MPWHLVRYCPTAPRLPDHGAIDNMNFHGLLAPVGAELLNEKTYCRFRLPPAQHPGMSSA